MSSPKPARCPMCKQPLLDDAAQQPRPFCSKRCKTADLGNWLDGRYVIADERSPADLGDLGDLTPEELERLSALYNEDGKTDDA